MGCDIHIWAEKVNDFGTRVTERLAYNDETRCYGAFAFLAGIRNYSGITPLDSPRGLPPDCDELLREKLSDSFYHSHSWFTLDELNAVNYDKLVENRRYSAEVWAGFVSGSCTAPKGQGTMMPLRQIINKHYVNLFKRLKDEGYTRIIFAFDN